MSIDGLGFEPGLPVPKPEVTPEPASGGAAGAPAAGTGAAAPPVSPTSATAAPPVDVYESAAVDPSAFELAAYSGGTLIVGGETVEPPETFTSDAPAEPSGAPAQGSPEAAAAHVIELSEVDDSATGANVFGQALVEHAGDEEWIQAYFTALGAEKAAELISHAGQPGTYSQWPVDLIEEQTGAVSDALHTLHEGGRLNQADMDRLMHFWTNDSDAQAFRGLAFGGNHYNSGIGQLIAETTDDGLKNLYFESAQAAALDTDLSGEIRSDVAASGAYVLAVTSGDNQVAQLDRLRSEGTLTEFVDRAMSGEAQIPTLLNGSETSLIDPADHARWEANDGIASLAFNLAYADVRDPWQGAPPVSNADLSAIRQEFFVAGAEGMGANHETWDSNPVLKDGLSVIFRKEFEGLVFNNLSMAGSSLQNDSIQAAVEEFFEHGLFTETTGTQRDATSEFVADTFGDWITDIRELSDEDFLAKYGVDQTVLAALSGEVLGLMNNGMENALSAAGGRQADQEAILTSMFDLGFSLLPGGGPLKSAAGKLTGEGALVLGRLLGYADGKIRSELEGATREQAQSLFIEENPGLVEDDVLAGFADALNDFIPESNDRNYLTAFRAGYLDSDNRNEST